MRQKNVCIFLELQGSLTVNGCAVNPGFQDPLTDNGFAVILGLQGPLFIQLQLPSSAVISFPFYSFGTFWSELISVNTWQVKDRVVGYELGSEDHHDGDSDSETRR